MPARTAKRKGRASFFRDGDNNVICDRTGFKYKASACRFEWNGLFVNKGSWEQRQPQDFVRGTGDNQNVAVNRPEAEDTFLGTNEVTRDSL